MATNKRSAIQKRDDSIENDSNTYAHQPAVSNSLKIKLDHLKTFEALTKNQQKFFDAYKQGDYFIGLLGSPGVGKAQPLYSKILTENGWKNMGEIQVGDIVHSKNSLTKVTGVFPQGEKSIYELTFSDGAKTRCSDEHLWECYVPSKLSNAGTRSGKTIKKVVDTNFIIQFMEGKKSGQIKPNLSIDLYEPINKKNVELPIDPYLLGVIIGDCSLTNSNIVLSTSDEEMVINVNSVLPKGYDCIKVSSKYEYNIRELNKTEFKNSIKEELKLLGLDGKLSYDKFIPEKYLQSSTEQKLHILQGLLDTDGTVGSKNGAVSFSTSSFNLALDVCDLVRSIGGKCSIREKKTYFTYNGKKKQGRDAYILNISYKEPKKLFRLTRKKNLCSEAYDTDQYRRIIKDIQYIGKEECQCIMVDDPSHLYVTDDYVLTHNTFLALYRAIEEVLNKDNPFSHVVVVRSAVQVRDQGFVPGTLEEKMEIYEVPYKEICETLFGRKDAWERLKEQGYARFISTTAIRGISIDNSIIIVDECQSMTFHELSSVMSRVGHRSKIMFIGDLKQNDLIKSRNDVSGLSEFLNVARHMNEFSEISFTPDDIVRSSLVKSWIIACDKMGF
jgi:hypothetical protein